MNKLQFASRNEKQIFLLRFHNLNIWTVRLKPFFCLFALPSEAMQKTFHFSLMNYFSFSFSLWNLFLSHQKLSHKEQKDFVEALEKFWAHLWLQGTCKTFVFKKCFGIKNDLVIMRFREIQKFCSKNLFLLITQPFASHPIKWYTIPLAIAS